MNLTLEERETVILFNEKDSTASVDTCNPSLIRKLDKQITLQENTTASLIREDEFGKAYLIPKSWVKVSPPPSYSAETLAKKQATARALAEKRRAALGVDVETSRITPVTLTEHSMNGHAGVAAPGRGICISSAHKFCNGHGASRKNS